jgi:hypothetical protein
MGIPPSSEVHLHVWTNSSYKGVLTTLESLRKEKYTNIGFVKD